MAGDISSKGLTRLEREVLSHAPDYVLLMFGAEDVLQGIESAAFRESLEKMVERIAARNIHPGLADAFTEALEVDLLERPWGSPG